MPTLVNDLFKTFGLTITGQVKWMEEIPSDDFGVYVIALTNKADQMITLDRPDFNTDAISEWIRVIRCHGKNILIDQKIASVQEIKYRLAQFWLPDETIIYIGKVGPTEGRTFRVRINEFYQTRLGCDKKHAGGHWINVLKGILNLNLYYSVYDNPSIEEDMIEYFCSKVSNASRVLLHDKERCYPFANKEKNKRTRKKHGLSNQTVDCGKTWKR